MPAQSGNAVVARIAGDGPAGERTDVNPQRTTLAASGSGSVIEHSALGASDEMTSIAPWALAATLALSVAVLLLVILHMTVGHGRARGTRKRMRGQKNGAKSQRTEQVSRASPSSVAENKVPEPEVELQRLRERLSSPDQTQTLHSLPADSRDVTLATHKGNVRKSNEDYGLCFAVTDCRILIVADGCGGIPHGGRAAYLATRAAADTVARAIGTQASAKDLDLETIADAAMREAAVSLAQEGERLGVVKCSDGLRTTLIVVIADRERYAYAYIGDGGGVILRDSGNAEPFLKPQKASGSAANVLAASLGPAVEGKWNKGTLQQRAGDLLLCGTDGVFDFVDGSFPEDVGRALARFDGDLQRVADSVVRELAEARDKQGWLCSDNLTLGLIADDTSETRRCCLLERS